MSAPSIFENLFQANALLEKVTSELKSNVRLSEAEAKVLKEVLNSINRFRKLYIANLVVNGQAKEAAEIFDVTHARTHHIKAEMVLFKAHGRKKPGTLINVTSSWGNVVTYCYGRDEMPYRLRMLSGVPVTVPQKNKLSETEAAVALENNMAEVLSERWHVVGEVRDRVRADLQAVGECDPRTTTPKYAITAEDAHARIEARTPAHIYRHKRTGVWFYSDSGVMKNLPYMREWAAAQLLMSPSMFVERHAARKAEYRQLSVIEAMLAIDQARSAAQAPSA